MAELDLGTLFCTLAFLFQLDFEVGRAHVEIVGRWLKRVVVEVLWDELFLQ
jgi:hypothetical protein